MSDKLMLPGKGAVLCETLKVYVPGIEQGIEYLHGPLYMLHVNIEFRIVQFIIH